jgi:predicted XRE-type DNA-binding protein
MAENFEMHDISELMDIPKEYYSISVSKLNITREIKEGLEKKNLSVRKLAKNIGLQHPQIVRVTSANNYNIDTLLKILDGLDLEIEIKPKKNIHEKTYE